MNASVQTVSTKTVALYAIGSLGTGGFATLPGLVLVYYLTDTLGLGALIAGLVVTAAKVWDVLIDPVIGTRSDHSLATTGSRRRLMLLGGSFLPIFFILTFAVPAGANALLSALWVLLAFLACATAFSLFQVPYIALPTELAPGYHDRTRLLTWRVVVLTIAILLFGAGGPLLRGAVEDSRLGYLLMALVAGLVIGAGMLVASMVAPRSPALTKRGSLPAYRESYRAGITILRRSQPFRALLGTFMLQGLATGLMLAGAQYVATWVLRSEDAVTLLFVVLIGPALLLAPLWGTIARRIGKERAFRIASALFTLAALSMVGLMWVPGAWIYLPVALAGAAYAGMQTLPMAMLPDVISHDAQRHGAGKAGIFGGVWTAGETTGMAFGATVLTLVLAITGYTEHVAGEVVEQTPTAVAGIILAFSVVPAALMAASLVTLGKYRLRQSDIDTATTPTRETTS
ncbi:Na+/melibiose symporter-like transporter [Okibacterium sp. HSC-33S16]|uniref:MFS transporter n=1 Tax=Okibacterium sp. HSC-33S16 TaxID=2910965 RepID=UPI00209E32CC|nr:MFS transporter [Okibacterium sp. HSC-33S16]MCP2031507.1 Na+/melibiose symporter-like transporter [Okibacterium sp. HSC-33S16]